MNDFLYRIMLSVEVLEEACPNNPLPPPPPPPPFLVKLVQITHLKSWIHPCLVFVYLLILLI